MRAKKLIPANTTLSGVFTKLAQMRAYLEDGEIVYGTVALPGGGYARPRWWTREDTPAGLIRLAVPHPRVALRGVVSVHSARRRAAAPCLPSAGQRVRGWGIQRRRSQSHRPRVPNAAMRQPAGLTPNGGRRVDSLRPYGLESGWVHLARICD
jgi:hypothetical protein